MKRIYAFLLIAVVSLTIEMVHRWPWWTYLAACFILGFALPFKRWKASVFFSGFIAGSIVWLGGTIFYDSYYSGSLLDTVAKLLLMSYPVLLLLIGCLGGLLSGLVVYSGFLLRKGWPIPNLELPAR